MSMQSHKKVMVCTNFRANPSHPSCGARDSDTVLTALSEALLDLPIITVESPCMGLCHTGPNVRLSPNGTCFHEVNAQRLDVIIEEVKMFIKC
ncbi:MAG: (2Fe-2S) ferredoxin domain-containing protein [Methylophilaceae bacterium]